MGTKKNKDQTRAEVLKKYLRIAKGCGGRSPSLADLEGAGLTRNTIRHHFGTRAAIDELARIENPKAFKDAPLNTIDHADPKSKTIILTSVVVGADIHPGFCNALAKLAERKGADLLALPVADPASRATPNGIGRIDGRLLKLGFQIVRGDIDLNDSLQVLGIEASAKQILPLTGLKRFGQRGRSLIVPSPKLFLECVPTLGKTPHVLMTPGACTVPNYGTDTHRSKRTAYLAEQDHKLSAIIVELEGEDRFHFRQLIWNDKRKDVVDQGETHNGKAYKPQAVCFGDLHVGSTARECWDFILDNVYAAKDAYIHDGFDGYAVNNHARPLETLTDTRSLEWELIEWKSAIEKIAAVYRTVYIVASNHDDRIARWLAEGKHLKDRLNFVIGRKLEGYLLAGANVLEAYFQQHSDFDNVVFLSKDESHQIGGVEMSQHGHQGGNGHRKPSLKSLEQALGPCCVGHSHTPGIYREAWQAGTSTELKLDYTSGPSSWMWSHILVYPDGRRQMINLVP